MKETKVIISKDVEQQLEYFCWDVTELRQSWSKIFPDAKVIKITDCEDNWLEVQVDGEFYTINATGDIKDGTIYEGKR